MSPAIDTARELLARTRNISAALDSLLLPHQQVISLKSELSREPFTELERTRAALLAELTSIENLLGRGLVNEAGSSISAYEGRVGLILPSLHRLAGMRRGIRAMDAAVPALDGIEDLILSHELRAAESAMSAVQTLPALPSPPASPSGEDTIRCALCGRAVRADLDLCPYCGWEPGAPAGECPECGSTVLLRFQACPACWKRLPKAGEARAVVPPLLLG